MDPADISAGLQEQMNTSAVRNARSDDSALPRNGRCHFCKEEVEPWELFCDTDCRDDYEREQAARQRKRGCL